MQTNFVSNGRWARAWRHLSRAIAGAVLMAAAGPAPAASTEATHMTTPSETSLSAVPPAAWQRLASKRIYFGHQSVGDNIILGLHEVLAQHPEIKLRVQEKPGLVNADGPLLIHSYIGLNDQPLSKNTAFADAIRDSLHGRADVAFFKYCFVDVERSSDPAMLFGEYQKTMATLQRQYPNMLYVHFTVPLMTVQTGWRASIKRALGMEIGGYADNIKRNEYNELLRKEYASRGTLFDIARLEATRRDGSVATFQHEGHEYMTLADEYTRDGGHLNEVGRRYVAEQLLVFLAQRVSEDTAARQSKKGG